MPSIKKTPPRKRAPAASIESKPDASQPAEARGAKRRRDTRARLLGAALHLMAQKGVAGVTINEITDQADVGFGSFYNHFESKEAIHAALLEEVIGNFAAALDKLGEQLTDPAEKIAASARYTLLRGQADPVWGRFVFQTHFNRDSLTHGLGRYLLQDIGTGLAAGRFKVVDLPAVSIAVGSSILGGLAVVSQELRSPDNDSPTFFGDASTLAERIAAVLLTVLGLPAKEAHRVAGRPLPQIELPANPFAQG